MKTCKYCGHSKPRSAFNADRTAKDGLQARCRACFKEYNQRRTESGIAAERQREYSKTEHGGKAIVRAVARWKEKNRDKVKAHVAVRLAIRAGKIARPSECESCGASGRIEGHHKDYAEPLDVRWLCVACHNEEHKHD